MTGLLKTWLPKTWLSKTWLSNIFGRVALAAAATALVSASAFADATPQRVRGSVVSLDGSKLVVHAKDGKDITVNLADNFAALAVVKSSLAEIKEGTFIGTATVTQPDSSLRSQEVVVFPDKMRGTGEGHYPWDLGSKSMMTNATVSNAVKSVEGQSVIVTYKGGEKKIDVPADVPAATSADAPARSSPRNCRTGGSSSRCTWPACGSARSPTW